MHRGGGQYAGCVLAAVVAFWQIGGATRVMAQDDAARASATQSWAAQVTDQLKLDPAQQAAFRDYMAALADESWKQPSPSEEQLRVMTMPDRLDYAAGHMELALKAMRAQSAAIHRLYAVLSPDQRKLFDAATMPQGKPPSVATVVNQPLPDRPDYKLPGHTDPGWLVKPDADDIARVYPSAAQRQHISGKVELQCTVDLYGYLTDCIVASETPKDQGFGNAALELTAYIRMQPATTFGIPTPSSIVLPLSFVASDR
jgi:TonB family protein